MKRSLHPLCTRKFLGRLNAGDQAHERRRVAEDNRVDVDREHLYKALLCRVRNHSCRSRVRRRTDTRLVGVETSLDTVDQAGTRNAAEDCAEVKRIGEDTTNDRRNSARMHDEDHQRDHHIGNAHERNHETRGLLNALAAAHHADADQNCEHGADCHGRKLRVCLIPSVSLEG